MICLTFTQTKLNTLARSATATLALFHITVDFRLSPPPLTLQDKYILYSKIIGKLLHVQILNKNCKGSHVVLTSPPRLSFEYNVYLNVPNLTKLLLKNIPGASFTMGDLMARSLAEKAFNLFKVAGSSMLWRE